MTKKDFFRIIIKLFGLYSLITALFYLLPGQIAILTTDFTIQTLILIVFVFVASLALLLLLIYKADTIISWLDLDSGFEEDRIYFENFNEENILKLAIIIIGGMLLLDNAASFLKNIYYALQYDNQSYLGTMVFGVDQKFELAVNFINIIIGYLLVSNYSFLTRKFLSVKESPGK